MSRFLSLVLVLFSATACVTTEDLQDWSSGETGCDPEEIDIAQEKTSASCGSTNTWIAICDGQKYRCTNSIAQDCSQQISCKKKPKKPKIAE